MKVYIAGKITGDPLCKERFEDARKKLTERGHIVLNPSTLPSGMSNSDYMRICFAMIDVCDAARAFSVPYTNILAVCQHLRKTVKGYKWEYYKEGE